MTTFKWKHTAVNQGVKIHAYQDSWWIGHHFPKMAVGELWYFVLTHRTVALIEERNEKFLVRMHTEDPRGPAEYKWATEPVLAETDTLDQAVQYINVLVRMEP